MEMEVFEEMIGIDPDAFEKRQQEEVKKMEFWKDDVVVITCEHPLGADNTNVFGRIGVVIDIDKSDGEIYYNVKDTHGDDFLYVASELRDASYEEIALSFINIVKERI